ncbi:ABC transporter ATP-binding protein [Rhodoplanes sp. TEM]|uniref:ABC transporter ATP-binding protein n=1 Tax=Rhodoplanes tepidamans TaxID=200616 RepID=A0ABT5JC68_RHOTP|nr:MULTISPECIES: ABC transporter ATP-binding protein [Rhodoplanes]MDC7786859.1 ABC transporter ATP-binding protein [Rhodoplanes tepidamans]MDC7984212.1 ABC transporter ATP-binding protein [Rhodoplanes sp. TEM]MDQ0355987.1 iron(III) transport system ATP-binding protein [Rhodoplanes tepidamans]
MTALPAAPTSASSLSAPSVDIAIEHVDLWYGSNHVLRDVDLRIEPGEFFAFLGPSGCGKTTLLRLIAGFNQADRGRVLIAGRDVSGLPPWKRDVGMVFQSYALWPHMTVEQNIAFGLEERRLPRQEIRKRVAAALDLVGLGGLEKRRPAQLSGGQQQRVALARTIVVEPKVLLLDEPLSNLDAKLRGEVRRELRELQQRLGLTAIFVTHDQEEANTICDRIAVMKDGTVQQVGAPTALYDAPRNLFVAGFLGTTNILQGRVLRDCGGVAFETAAGTIPLPAGALPGGDVPPGAKLVFRPHHAILSRPGVPLAEGRARLPGTIRFKEFLGATERYGIAVAGGVEGSTEVSVDLTHGTAPAGLEPGTAVAIDITLDRLHVLGE